jgi:hypothetical protein
MTSVVAERESAFKDVVANHGQKEKSLQREIEELRGQLDQVVIFTKPFQTKFSDKIFGQNFWTKFSDKIFGQNFWTKFSDKIFGQNFRTKFSDKS